MSKIRINNLIEESIVDGPGFRFTIFTQGCFHNCLACHNQHTHSLNGGYEIDMQDLFEKIVANELIDGVTLSGGEPFLQPEPLLELIKKIRTETNLNIIIYSGYTFEQLMAMKSKIIYEILTYTFLLIDGKYIEEERDLTLLYRGSKNQRIIDVEKSLEKNSVINYEFIKYI